jgi:hypothetical protein
MSRLLRSVRLALHPARRLNQSSLYWSSLLLCLLAAAPQLTYADGRTAMLDAMQAMVDTMANFVGAGRSSDFGNWGGSFDNLGSGLGGNSDLAIIYRNMPGVEPRSSLSRTQLLDGIWRGRQGDILMIRDGNARLLGYNHAFHEEAEIELQPTRMQIRNLGSGIERSYDYAYRDGRLALRDKEGNILLYRRLNRVFSNRLP